MLYVEEIPWRSVILKTKYGIEELLLLEDKRGFFLKLGRKHCLCICISMIKRDL